MGTFKFYGYVGLLIIGLAEIALFREVWIVQMFFTPIAWTGYILFIDALLAKLAGRSYLTARRKELAIMAVLSVIGWTVFEVYNLHLANWYYHGLPGNMAVRLFGFVWAFATIFPGVLITSDVIDASGMVSPIRVPMQMFSRSGLISLAAVGAIFVAVPVFLPQSIARYLFAFVWIGYIFLLDPINYALGAPSILRHWERGRADKFVSLFLAGGICGLLWEFWNYWALTRWIYDVPFLSNPKYFEMPLIGFLGFFPFAVECFAIYYFMMAVLQRLTKRELYDPTFDYAGLNL